MADGRDTPGEDRGDERTDDSGATRASAFRIGMPPGMEPARDTVPSTDQPEQAPPTARVPSQAPVTVRRPEFGVAPVRAPASSGVAPPASSQPARPASPWLLLPDNSVIPLGHGVIVGRDPQPQDGYGVEARARLHDVERSVSKTHAVIGVSEGRVWVIDLNSTNGTTIVTEDGDDVPCRPEVATPVPRGASARFGEYLVRIITE
ncbi:hypothetical protein GCM10027416_26570 [Okibacterium endophyticum]